MSIFTLRLGRLRSECWTIVEDMRFCSVRKLFY